MTGQAHGRYFTWHGQWFHIWCEFIDQNNTISSKASMLNSLGSSPRTTASASINKAGTADTSTDTVAPSRGPQHLALLPCSAGLNGSRWKAVTHGGADSANSSVVFVSLDDEHPPLCIDIAHPKSLPIDEVYAYPCTYAANEQWVSTTAAGLTVDSSSNRLQSAEFSLYCLGVDTTRHSEAPLMVPCGSAPSWYLNANGQLEMVTATPPASSR